MSETANSGSNQENGLANSEVQSISTVQPTENESKASPSGIRRHSEESRGPGLLEMVAGDDRSEEEEKLAARSSSIIKFYPECCRCFLRTSEPLSADASFRDQFRDFFRCPPKGTLARILLSSFICIFLWGFLYYLLKPLSKDHHHGTATNPAWVYGPIFALGIVEITGLLFGFLLKKFLNLPPLLGPLILGILYRNIPALNLFILMKGFNVRSCGNNETCEDLAEQSVNDWVKPIRVIALGIILTRAGLELSPKQLSKLKGVVPLLAFSPCVIEACACAIISFLFFNVMQEVEHKKMSLAMCFVGGFALAAVSPAVVVPGALSLKKAGYGVAKGVPTLLIAASSIDDVLAISVYTIALGFAIEQSGEPAWKSYSGGVIGLVVGILHGAIFGMILHFLPSRISKYKAQNRLLLLLLINFTSILAYEETFFNGAGSICVLVTSLISGFGWRSQPHWKLPMKKIEKTLAHMWVMWVPLIFGTIGKEINFLNDAFKPPTIFKIFGVIFLSLTFRCLAAFIASGCGTGFNFKEKIFVALSWIPKATVQAALAPLVLTRASILASEHHGEKEAAIKENAEIVVNIAILAVLITAPVGCVLIALLGPKCLEQKPATEIIMEIEEEFPNGGGIDPEESTFELMNEAEIEICTHGRRKSGEPDVEIRKCSLDEAPEPPPPPPAPPSQTKSILSFIGHQNK